MGLIALLFVATEAAPGRAQSATMGPELSDFPTALWYSAWYLGASPAGANDWSCTPPAAHPLPVVLVHGTAENAFDNWAELAPMLRREGYCVFALDYGGYAGTSFRGMTDIAASAVELSLFVNRVLASTGASQVDLVGHSQGGMMPRFYLRFLGGAAKVHQLIALAPSNYGTTASGARGAISVLPGGLGVLAVACLACEQQFRNSPFLTALNFGGDTVPGVSYTVIATAFDEVVTPYTDAFLRGGVLSGSAVTNLLLQAICPLDNTDHLGISYDPIALRLVLNALDPSSARSPACRYVPPLFS